MLKILEIQYFVAVLGFHVNSAPKSQQKKKTLFIHLLWLNQQLFLKYSYKHQMACK